MPVLKTMESIANDGRLSPMEINEIIGIVVHLLIVTVVVTGMVNFAISALEIKKEPESYVFHMLDSFKGFVTF